MLFFKKTDLQIHAMKNQDINPSTFDTSEQEQDISSIRQVVADAETFQNDPDKFCQLLTEEVAIVNIAGRRVIGRQAFYEIMKKAVATPLAEVITRNEVVNISFIRPDVAVVSCIKSIVEKGNFRLEGNEASLTFTMTKEQGKWLIATAQSTFIKK
jgi:uncharacterized protein (TIGR02246 family)